MNKAQELFEKVKEMFDNYDPEGARKELDQMEQRGRQDVFNKAEWGYYSFLPCLINFLKPRQIIELGGAMGVSTLMFLSALPEESKLYSITLPENGLEFSFIKERYPQLVKVIGNDLDENVWPKDIDWNLTDLLFIDTKHEKEQLEKELNLYLPRLLKGCVILFDDIKINTGMFEVWVNLSFDKYDASILHIPSGFGIAIV